MNKILLIGNLGRDPEMNYIPSGAAVTKFSIAVSGRGKDAESTWFNIVCWNKLAETAANYLKKGNKVYIEGRLEMRKYDDKNGVSRTSVEVIATDMEFLTPKSQSSSNSDNGEDSELGELEDHPF